MTRRRRDFLYHLALLGVNRFAPPSDGAAEFVEVNGFNPGDASVKASELPDWTQLTGLGTGIQQSGNRWYAAKTSDWTGVRWSNLPAGLTTDDNWMTVEADGLWNDDLRFFGPALRCDDDQASFYAFMNDGISYQFWRGFEGAFTVEKSGALTQLAEGDIVKITVEGDTVKGYVNDVLIDTYTDVEVVKNTTGDPGFVVKGLDLQHGYKNFRCGDLNAIGTPVVVFGDFAANEDDERHYLDSCFTSDPTDSSDGALNSSAGHASSVVPHFVEFDFLELRVPQRVRSHGITTDTFDWSDVDVLTKVEAGDDWVEVATALDLDNDGVDGWRTSGNFAIVQPCRYVRVEINATLDPDNHILTEEVEFECVAIP